MHHSTGTFLIIFPVLDFYYIYICVSESQLKLMCISVSCNHLHLLKFHQSAVLTFSIAMFNVFVT